MNVSNYLSRTLNVSHSGHNTIKTMEGLRGFAVILVFFVHFISLLEPSIPADTAVHAITKVLTDIGHTGVDLFFFLSGYLIYGMLISKETPFNQYFKRRLRRIYPTFFAVFCIYFILSFVFPSETKIPQSFDGVLYVIQNLLFLPGIFDIQPMISVAWTLSYEFFFYLLTPLVIYIFNLKSWSQKNRLYFLLLVSLTFYVLFFLGLLGHIRLTLFISGAILYELITLTKNIFVPKIPSLVTLLISFICIVVFDLFEVNSGCRYLVLFLGFNLMCYHLFNVKKGVSYDIFANVFLRQLGNMSYSYYLMHGLTLKFIFLVFNKLSFFSTVELFDFLLLLVGCFYITLLPSYILFIIVEKKYSF